MSGCPVCNACGVKELWFVRLKGSRTGKYNPLYYCRKCDFFFQRPHYLEDDKMLQGDLQWHLNKQELSRTRAKKIISEALAISPETKTMLDIGCGVGISILVARECGLNAQGVEINPYAVRYAKENFALDLIQQYFSANIFSVKFDLIVVDNVMEHVVDPRSFVKDVFSILNLGGLIYLAVPGRKGGILRICHSLLFPRYKDSMFLDNDVHINHFSRISILKLIEPYHASIQQEISSGTYIIQTKK